MNFTNFLSGCKCKNYFLSNKKKNLFFLKYFYSAINTNELNSQSQNPYPKTGVQMYNTFSHLTNEKIKNLHIIYLCLIMNLLAPIIILKNTKTHKYYLDLYDTSDYAAANIIKLLKLLL